MSIDRLDPESAARRREATDWFLRLQDGPLGDRELADWLAWCDDAANLQAFEFAQGTWSALGAAAAATATATSDASTTYAPSRGIGARLAAWWRPRTAWLAGTALAFTLAFCAVAVWSLRDPPVADQFTTASGNGPETRLPDGSVLVLGARSSVSMRFVRGRRDLALTEGEAFFRVAHDARRPFVVDTGALAVRAVGTAFDIRRHGDRVSLAVEEGVVEVHPRDADGSAAPWRVPAGTMLTWTGRGHDMRMLHVDPESAASWRQGRLEYFGEPLSAVVASINRYAARRIVLADESLGQLVYTGAVLVQSVDDWLAGLPASFPVRTLTQPDGSVLIARRIDVSAPRPKHGG